MSGNTLAYGWRIEHTKAMYLSGTEETLSRIMNASELLECFLINDSRCLNRDEMTVWNLSSKF